MPPCHAVLVYKEIFPQIPFIRIFQNGSSNDLYRLWHVRQAQVSSHAQPPLHAAPERTASADGNNSTIACTGCGSIMSSSSSRPSTSWKAKDDETPTLWMKPVSTSGFASSAGQLLRDGQGKTEGARSNQRQRVNECDIVCTVLGVHLRASFLASVSAICSLVESR
jgi:hypothetical protein